MEYPTIDLSQLGLISRLIDEANSDPDILMPGVAPYDGATLDILKKFLQPVVGRVSGVEANKNPVGRPSNQVVLPISEVEKEIDEIRKEIGQLKIDGQQMETADRIQIIKTRAALVEKIIAMKERVNNLKEQRAFINQVIMIMEDILDQKQREEMIERLKPYLEE